MAMNYVPAFIALVASFFIGMLIAPVFLRISSRLKTGQPILSYVEQHSDKKATPTMGGFLFLFSTAVVTLAFGGYKSNMTLVVLLIFTGYGFIGFLDDFVKIKLKRNMGLRAYQKIVAQVAIAVIAAFYCARNPHIGTAVYVPVLKTWWEMGAWYIPFAAVTFLAMTNSVNLTDGLDGLAGSTNAIYFTAFLGIIFLGLADAVDAGSVLYANELTSLSVFAGALIGGLAAFLWFNSHKAKFFMGDTGSLALGGAAAAVALFVKNPLISILIGGVFVLSSVSVIVQVASFKARKKRVFLMAPFHHHLELKGYNETKIVAFYSIATVILAVTAFIII